MIICEFSSGNMGRVLPEYLSKWTTNKVKAGNQFPNAIFEINDTVLAHLA